MRKQGSLARQGLGGTPPLPLSPLLSALPPRRRLWGATRSATQAATASEAISASGLSGLGTTKATGTCAVARGQKRRSTTHRKQ